MAGQPDPKGAARIVDPLVVRRFRLVGGDQCAACGDPPGSVHHVIERSAPYHGDDVPGNLVLVCGTGTDLCHGALHGNPYQRRRGLAADDSWNEYRDGEWVRRRLGIWIKSYRPDTVAYVLEKLGDIPGRDYLARHYFLELAAG